MPNKISPFILNKVFKNSKKNRIILSFLHRKPNPFWNMYNFLFTMNLASLLLVEISFNSAEEIPWMWGFIKQLYQKIILMLYFKKEMIETLLLMHLCYREKAELSRAFPGR